MTVVTGNSQPIVVGIDGSQSSHAALRWALHEGVATGAPVEVVHGWEAETLIDAVLASRHEMSCGSECMLDNEVKSILDEMTEQPTVTKTSVHGRPATVLLDRAAHARVLVIGAQEHQAIRDLFRGSVAPNLRKRATCPVVVVDGDNTVTWRGPNRYVSSTA